MALSSDKNIGIVGCGHLGLSIAETLLKKRYIKKENLYLSCKGNESSLTRIKKADLLDRLFSNDEIARSCEFIFLTVKPKDVFSLGNIKYGREAIIISFVAGVNSQQLRELIDAEKIVRGIISGPKTISARKAVIAITQAIDSKDLTSLLGWLSMHFFIVKEDLIDVLSSIVTLPGLMALAEKYNRMDEIRKAMFVLKKNYHIEGIDLDSIYEWGLLMKPAFESDDELHQYIFEMSTKGGVSNAVMTNFKNGCTALDSIEKGILRCKDLIKN